MLCIKNWRRVHRRAFRCQSSRSACDQFLAYWQVPFKLRDEDIPDDWSCERNVWDREHASCSVPQALTDEEIDEILALQVDHLKPYNCPIHLPCKNNIVPLALQP